MNHLVGAVLLNESIAPVCKSEWIKYKDHLAESWKESVRQLLFVRMAKFDAPTHQKKKKKS